MGDRIGVMVELEGGSEQLAVDVAMHVAAMNPPYAVAEEVPQDVLEKEKGILRDQALESGKPPEIVDKMIEGRIRKYLEEICLVSQTYVRTNDRTVGKLLEENGAKMVGFTRIAVGEGIKKKEDNFAEEVAKMAGKTEDEANTQPSLEVASEPTVGEAAKAIEESKSVEVKEVTVSMIKELREETGAGMMDCKRALVENDGDAEAAKEFLRKKGLAKADKKAGRVAAEGKIVVAK